MLLWGEDCCVSWRSFFGFLPQAKSPPDEACSTYVHRRLKQQPHQRGESSSIVSCGPPGRPPRVEFTPTSEPPDKMKSGAINGSYRVRETSPERGSLAPSPLPWGRNLVLLVERAVRRN